MLRTTCKQALENIRGYIVANFDACGYDDFKGNEDNFKDVASFIYDTFMDEMGRHDKRRMSEQELFFEWCQGLPSVLDTCYYYNRSAVNDLAVILEESDSEQSKYTEEQAEKQLTWLIYREIKKAVK